MIGLLKRLDWRRRKAPARSAGDTIKTNGSGSPRTASATTGRGRHVEDRRPPQHDYLAAHRVEKSFGGRKVVRGVSLYVRRGEAVGLLGPNGAGKTTVF